MRSISMSLLFIFLTTVGCQSVKQEEFLERSYVHEYGLPVEGNQWMDCGANGKVLSTLRNGVTVSQTYQNGLLEGESTYTYPHCSQLERTEYYSGNHIVSQVFYSLSGVPTRSISYSRPNTRVITEWYEHGSPRSIETFNGTILTSGEYYTLQNQCDSRIYNGNGERYLRNDLGELLSLDTFQGGQQVLKEAYYTNGSPKEICSMKNGILHGERKTYYPAGEPMAIENWDNGCQSGMTIVFQNGEKFAEVPYQGNMKHGIEKRFRDGCIVTQEIAWMYDKKHGPCHTYVGEFTDTDWYYKGHLTTRINFESYGDLPRQL